MTVSTNHQQDFYITSSRAIPESIMKESKILRRGRRGDRLPGMADGTLELPAVVITDMRLGLLIPCHGGGEGLTYLSPSKFIGS